MENAQVKTVSEVIQCDMFVTFPRRQRRARRKFTKEDDDSIIQGHAKYGPVWHKIRDDPCFNLSSRKATDLRDRFRNLYPELFAKTSNSMNLSDVAEPADLDLPHLSDPFCPSTDPLMSGAKAGNKLTTSTVATSSQPAQSQEAQSRKSNFFSPRYLPDFFTEEHDSNFFNTSASPITLSRKILDWGEEQDSQMSSVTVDASASVPEPSQGINPLMTLQGWKAGAGLTSSNVQIPPLAVPGKKGSNVEEKSDALSLPPLNEPLLPFDMTVGGLL